LGQRGRKLNKLLGAVLDMSEICLTCAHAIHPPDEYEGREDTLACPEFGLVNERDSCKGWEAKEDEEDDLPEM